MSFGSVTEVEDKVGSRRANDARQERARGIPGKAHPRTAEHPQPPSPLAFAVLGEIRRYPVLSYMM